MPYTITTITLPSGTRCIQAEASGVISKEDAEYLMTFIGPGGSMYLVPMLVQAQKMKSFSPGARTVFGSVDPNKDMAWCGTVVTNALIRVAINFMLRVNGSRKVRMFSSEEEAIRWLDERAREDASKSKAT